MYQGRIQECIVGTDIRAGEICGEVHVSGVHTRVYLVESIGVLGVDTEMYNAERYFHQGRIQDCTIYDGVHALGADIEVSQIFRGRIPKYIFNKCYS